MKNDFKQSLGVEDILGHPIWKKEIQEYRMVKETSNTRLV